MSSRRKTSETIGAMRDRIEVQSVTETKDGIGSPVQSWATLYTLWADVRQASNSETWRRQQMQSAAGWTIVIRYHADLTPQMRVKWNSRVFQIRGLENPDTVKRFLVIAAEELSATVLQ